MRALISGFEAFDGADVNVSEQLVRALEAQNRPNLACKVLPTAYRRAGHGIELLLRELRPQFVLMLGLNARAQHLHFEHVALNLDDSAKTDNDGEIRQCVRIHEGAPAAYFSTLQFPRLRQVAAEFGEELLTSRDAGGFVCNHAFFSAVHYAARFLPETQLGFVHVPPLLDAERQQRVQKLIERWLSL